MKRWLFREPPAGSPPRGLARELSISPLLLDILWRRGLDSPEELDAYLSARLPDLVPPSRWPQFPQAAEVISKGLLDGKKLAVWGDYDVDGITSSTLVLDVLEAHGLDALWHVPDRRSEGYGLNIPAIEELAAQGCGILLTVDCGISDMAAVARARELGMTVVVSDHHLPPPELPPADAICNPRLGPEDDMPCPHLAGVGVAFFLMAAVNAALAPHTGRRFKMDRVLDLVALGTLADVMRLGGQNRILVRGGLDKLAEAARPGIAALKTVSGSDAAARLNAGQVVFRLAPRINAAGRMGAADTALQLLRSKDHVEALRLAQHLDALNTQRREEEERIWAAAREQAHRQLEQRQRPALVLYGGDWHPGIVGIVASRIVEEFYRPTIILCDDNNMMKGSGRSIRRAPEDGPCAGGLRRPQAGCGRAPGTQSAGTLPRGLRTGRGGRAGRAAPDPGPAAGMRAGFPAGFGFRLLAGAGTHAALWGRQCRTGLRLPGTHGGGPQPAGLQRRPCAPAPEGQRQRHHPHGQGLEHGHGLPALFRGLAHPCGLHAAPGLLPGRGLHRRGHQGLAARGRLARADKSG